MPPWHIDRNVGIAKFKDDRSLSDEEIATIASWVDAGAPLGNPADMPPPRKFEDVDKWHIGTPDLIVSLPKDQIVPAAGPDKWLDIIVDAGLKEDRWLKAVETKPSKGFKVVHHSVQTMTEPDGSIDDSDNPRGELPQRVCAREERRHLPRWRGSSHEGGHEDQFQSPSPLDR